jgi:transposase
MGRPESSLLVKRVQTKELNNVIRDAEKNSTHTSRVRQRLKFIRMRYMGYSVPEAANIAGMSAQTGYNIQRLWNEGGLDALEPRFGGGRPPRLTERQKEDIVKLLRVKPMSTYDVRTHIMETYGVDYTLKQVHIILSERGLQHSKPDHNDTEGVPKKDIRMLWTVP